MRLEKKEVGKVLVAQVMETRLTLDLSEAFLEEMKALVQKGHRHVALDLSVVEFVDSAGLGSILALWKALREGGELALAGLQPRVAALLRLTRMDMVFRIFDSVEAAAAALNSPT